jgi:hypothetical protein
MKMLLSFLALLAAEPDSFAYREARGPVAVRAEVEAIQESLDKHRPDPGRSDRLARLVLALEAPSRTAYRKSLARVLRERRRIAEAERRMLEGPFETMWLNSRWMNSAVTARDPLARELFRRTFVDQDQTQTPLESSERKALEFLLRVDRAERIRSNSEWLRAAIARNGWFDISRYGPEASQAAWLLVQHSDYDPSWQRSVLAMLEPKVRTGDFQPNYYAYLEDRVAVNAGEAQSFGTQGRCVGKGDWQPFPPKDPTRLDERRASVGLEPIAKYRARFNCR